MHKNGKFSSLIQRMYDVDRVRSFITMVYYWDVEVSKRYLNFFPTTYEMQYDIYSQII